MNLVRRQTALLAFLGEVCVLLDAVEAAGRLLSRSRARICRQPLPVPAQQLADGGAVLLAREVPQGGVECCDADLVEVPELDLEQFEDPFALLWVPADQQRRHIADLRHCMFGCAVVGCVAARETVVGLDRYHEL